MNHSLQPLVEETPEQRDAGERCSVAVGSALAALSPVARAYHDEYWDWLWSGKANHQTIGAKKIELRNKYGPRAEEELLAALRADGYLPNSGSQP